MKARPITKAVAEALAQLTLERAREYKRLSQEQTAIAEALYMRAACEDIAATLLGAICGTEAELTLRRELGDGRRTAASFGPALRSEAESRAATDRNSRSLQRLRAARAPRPVRRFIDLTHPQD